MSSPSARYTSLLNGRTVTPERKRPFSAIAGQNSTVSTHGVICHPMMADTHIWANTNKKASRRMSDQRIGEGNELKTMKKRSRSSKDAKSVIQSPRSENFVPTSQLSMQTQDIEDVKPLDLSFKKIDHAIISGFEPIPKKIAVVNANSFVENEPMDLSMKSLKQEPMSSSLLTGMPSTIISGKSPSRLVIPSHADKPLKCPTGNTSTKRKRKRAKPKNSTACMLAILVDENGDEIYRMSQGQSLNGKNGVAPNVKDTVLPTSADKSPKIFKSLLTGAILNQNAIKEVPESASNKQCHSSPFASSSSKSVLQYYNEACMSDLDESSVSPDIISACDIKKENPSADEVDSAHLSLKCKAAVSKEDKCSIKRKESLIRCKDGINNTDTNDNDQYAQDVKQEFQNNGLQIPNLSMEHDNDCDTDGSKVNKDLLKASFKEKLVNVLDIPKTNKFSTKCVREGCDSMSDLSVSSHSSVKGLDIKSEAPNSSYKGGSTKETEAENISDDSENSGSAGSTGSKLYSLLTGPRSGGKSRYTTIRQYHSGNSDDNMNCDSDSEVNISKTDNDKQTLTSKGVGVKKSRVQLEPGSTPEWQSNGSPPSRAKTCLRSLLSGKLVFQDQEDVQDGMVIITRGVNGSNKTVDMVMDFPSPANPAKPERHSVVESAPQPTTDERPKPKPKKKNKLEQICQNLWQKNASKEIAH